MPVPRFRVLLVDPIRVRRESLAHELRFRFEVEGVATGPEAEAAVARQPVDAVVLSLRQTEGNGLAITPGLRRHLGSGPYVVVIGATEETLPTATRLALQQRHQVDHWIPRTVESPTLELLLRTELSLRRRAVKPAPEPEPARGLVGWWRSLLTPA